MPSAPSKVQLSTHSTAANEKHQDPSCRNYNYPLQLGDDFSTFPVGNVSLKSRPNKQYKKHQLSQSPQVLKGEKCQISSCIEEELCKPVSSPCMVPGLPGTASEKLEAVCAFSCLAVGGLSTHPGAHMGLLQRVLFAAPHPHSLQGRTEK